MSDAPPPRLVRLAAPDWIIVSALIVATLGLYARVARFDFINFDDDVYVSGNRRIRDGINADNVAWAFSTGYNSNWHPLTWISYMLDAQLFAARPSPMHLENAAIHAINSSLLFVALLMMTGNRWPAAWVAAMFAVHPLHVESVAWIAERKDVLSTFFLMLCLLAYWVYVCKPTAYRYASVLLAFILGLMCKPMLVSLPIVLLLLDFWPLGREIASEGAASPPLAPSRRILALCLEKLPLVAVASISAVITYIVQSAARSVSDAPLAMRISNAIVSYVIYLRQMLFPRGLAIFYPYQHWPISTTFACAAVLLILTLAAIATYSRAPYIAVGWFWYVITLLPVIGLVQVGSQAHADRYTYVPLIGIFMAIAWTVAAASNARASLRPMAIALAAVTVVSSSAVTFVQIGYWRGSQTLMRHAIDVVPGNYAAHSMLAEFYADQGDDARAANEYREALRIKPDDVVSLNNLAVQEAGAGRFAEALDLYHRAIAADANFAPAHDNLGNLLVKRGQIDGATREYRDAIARDPQYPQAYQNLALTLASTGKLKEAIDLWRRAIAIDPYYDDAHSSLGNALMMIGQGQQGIDEMRTALRLQPDRVDTLNSLAWILATHSNPAYRDGAESARLARRAVDLTHASKPIPLDTLAAAQARLGRFEDAIRSGERAADLAEEQNQPDLAKQIRRRLVLYRTGNPFSSRSDQ